MMEEQTEYNPEYVNDSGTVYHKYEVYEGEQSTSKYRNCEHMESFEAPNCVYSSPYNSTEKMLTGCNNLRSIKMPVAHGFGHYVFSGLSKLEYLELGSIGHPFSNGGYFRNDNGVRTIGSDAGLTIVAYRDSYNATAGFMNTVADNTIIIIRSATTGEIITE